MPDGIWQGEGSPTREDCVRLAVECANHAADAPEEVTEAWVRCVDAWVAIAKVAQAEPVDPAEVEAALCGHRRGVIRVDHWTNGRLSVRWMHATDMSECEDPHSLR
jgi:hypothetical protein